MKPYVSTKSKIGIEKMLDDDPESFYYCKEVQKKGDFFGVDLGVPREIRTVSIVMDRNDSDTDAVNRGQLEVSLDGQSWSPLMPESSGLRVEYRGNGKKAGLCVTALRRRGFREASRTCGRPSGISR